MVTPADLDRTDGIRAEAAAWLARLQDRNEATDRALQAWLKEDEAHRTAFNNATEIWDLLPGAVAFDDAFEDQHSQFAWRGWAIAATLLLMILGMGGSYAWFTRPQIYETSIGEQREILLEDGTLVALNTDSAIAVRYRGRERRVSLERGEALFKVHKDAARPFVVSEEDREVRALGTTFMVRRDPQFLAVTLIEGKVVITREVNRQTQNVATLAPGQRLRMFQGAGAAIDQPPMDVIMAWQGGEVMFDDVTLLEAAGELNRYTTTERIIVMPTAASLRISGVFSIREPQAFAETIAALYGLHIQRQGSEIILEPAPHQPAKSAFF
ncbi:FecR family protein [Sphingobium phenoxybenzoativorans]|uniref:FecR family protein n=1 Tax=Sphingobium phenoxybenzoativorans TaxID=1592790 RepID=UPI000872FEB6|nr:FecR domain-containing protein [Sphingobium phenoxybenzoativorans]